MLGLSLFAQGYQYLIHLVNHEQNSLYDYQPKRHQLFAQFTDHLDQLGLDNLSDRIKLYKIFIIAYELRTDSGLRPRIYRAMQTIARAYSPSAELILK